MAEVCRRFARNRGGTALERLTLQKRWQLSIPEASMREPKSFDEFWPYYLRQHSNPETRALHIVGRVVGLLGTAKAIRSRDPKWFVAGVASAYGMAWLG